MSAPCKFLDLKTKECIVYKERFIKQPKCMQLYEVLDAEYQPSTCGYVEELKEKGKEYKDPIIVNNLDDVKKKDKNE